jgi:type VI secretion system secreted protein VgrG
MGEEGICRDFSYTLELVSHERLIEKEFEQLLGGSVTVTESFVTKKLGKGHRFINGIVYHLKEIGRSKLSQLKEVWRYQLTIGSWLTQLRQVKDCRIFQKNGNTTISLIKDLLVELDLRDYRIDLTKTYPRRDLITQYDESTYHLIVRLLQTESILWRFEFHQHKHTLVCFDDISRLPEIDASHWGIGEGVFEFCQQSNHQPLTVCQLTDFDYENPPAKSVSYPANRENKAFRHFEYPGGFTNRSAGEQKVSRLHQTFVNEAEQFVGSSSLRLLTAGDRFRLKAPRLKNLHDRIFLITELRIEATRETYLNRFTASDAKADYGYPQSALVAKPKIVGTQTAVVVGSKEHPSQIQTDEAGRIRVRFHWDHHAPQASGNTSAFLRMAFPAAGQGRGMVFVPKIGEEVVVSFLDGDPDKPLIIGSVYSSNERAPLVPQSVAFQSVIRAQPGKDSNQLLFDDKAGSESFELNAKQDMTITVGHNLEIATQDAITITADALLLETNGNVLTGNVMALIGGNTVCVAGKSISNTTGLLVTGLTGALQNNLAGGACANIALGMVDNGSGGNMIFKGASIFNSTLGDVETTGEGGVKSKAMLVANTAKDVIENVSGGDIKQKAALAIVTKSENVNNTFSDGIKTQAIFVKEQGKTAIND